MADLSTLQQQDNFSTRLASKYTAGGATFSLQTAPSFTYATDFYLTVRPGTNDARSYKISGISGSTVTISGSAPVASYEGETPTSIDHPAGSKVIISNNYKMYDDIRDAINSKLDETGGTVASFDLQVTGSNFRIRKDGSDMKLTDDNQSEVTLSTLAAAAGTDEKIKISNNDTTNGYLNGKLTGGDGITLTEGSDGGNETLDVDVDLTDTTVFVSTSSGAGDSGKVPRLNGSGQLLEGFIPQVPASKTLTAGEDVDGSTTPQAVYISDGTNSRTSGRYYKADANDTTNSDSSKFFGFAKGNIATAATDNIYFSGVVSGFTGLTVGADYYLSDTAGAISATPGTLQVKVGRAVSTTEIEILKDVSVYVSAATSGSSSSTENVDTTFECGFRPSFIELRFRLTGNNSGTRYTAGSAFYKGTSLIGAQYMVSQGTDVTAATLAVNTSAPAAGNGGAGSLIELSVNSVTDTSVVVRQAYTYFGGAAATADFICIAHK